MQYRHPGFRAVSPKAAPISLAMQFSSQAETGYLIASQVSEVVLYNNGTENPRKEIHDHPSYKHELALDDEDESGTTVSMVQPINMTNTNLQAICNTQHDQGDRRQCSRTSSDNDDKVNKIGRASCRERVCYVV